MAEAVFHPPRRKRKVYESYESPFPISASHDNVYGGNYKICQAEIINKNVVVKNPEDIEQLYSKGFFGKGILSRSRPEYGISDPALVVKWKGAKLNIPVVSSKKFQRFVEWAKSCMREQGLDECTINKFFLNYIEPLNLEEETEQNSESQDEETQAMENTEPKFLVTSTETNEDRAASLEGDSQCDPLDKNGCKELDRTGFQATAKIHSPKNLLSLHDGGKQFDCVSQESSVLSNEEFNQQEFVLVQEEPDLSLEEEKANEKSRLNKREKLVCRRNPFRIFEYLQLSLEEAFFLAYALGCLSVYYNEAPLSILKLWEFFSEAQPSFRSTYMAYHYFRSKGWVPKVGLKYGTDLLLYRKGPPFYHASYSVIAELVNNDFEGSSHRPFTWKSLSSLNRTTANVSKELMFCYLIKPSDMTEKEMSSPECLKRIKVQELILNRWVSSRERNEQDEL
ncbi:tRNA-splicing endonuclease subunit Sen2 isoform X2 [Eublepharis macularius]|uniref:tRNA-splicing endonuclease subunit Sen2 n=1 Tax=Eublepharis macularius TaxID=481883 RepID=A0AA97KUR6_EUBMA|nr:tRNA-splicing endonuclease subunit Sen2 isoform X2 [Eublepharis macularius]